MDVFQPGAPNCLDHTWGCQQKFDLAAQLAAGSPFQLNICIQL
jgi:hypothetical protein